MSPLAKAEMITLARESRGYTQKELAERANVSQANVSKWESGLLALSGEMLERVSLILGYPPAFFFQTDSIYGYGSSCLYNRKRQSLPVHDLRRVIAQLNVSRMQIERLLHKIEVEVQSRFFRLDIEEYSNCPELIAQTVRQRWNLPQGPIENLTRIIEGCGGIVIKTSFGTRQLDAISQWSATSQTPLFFVNAEVPTDRLRFTLAHEIGHLIMHYVPTPNMELEADRFAAELLMPAKEIGTSLSPLSLQKIAQLKPYWKVSMAAIAKRAFYLGRITGRHYRTIFTQMSKAGIRKREPITLAPEDPTAMDAIVSIYRDEYGYTQSDLQTMLYSLDTEDFRNRFGPRKQNRLSLVK